MPAFLATASPVFGIDLPHHDTEERWKMRPATGSSASRYASNGGEDSRCVAGREWILAV